jgi:septal ring factor EnvC (AmiA/AmiB activator)
MNAALERRLPEQRLFLKSDDSTRYVRLKPMTQATMITVSALFVGWTAIVTSIFLLDTISAGGARDQEIRDRLTYQERLNSISDERDQRMLEARLSQDRFSVALTEVSQMQSRLLSSEERRKELETAVDVIQNTLRRTIVERDESRDRSGQLLAELEQSTGSVQTVAGRQRDMEQTLSFLAEALETTADARDDADAVRFEAVDLVANLEFEAELAAERNERIFTQIEEAVQMSLEPLDQMFRSVGMSTDQIIEQVRSGYSGQGGPLMPIAVSSRGEAPDEISLRANEVLERLDQVNLYRLAAEQLPFSMPVRASVRYTSGFGYRSDPINGGRRMHSGSDFAGPSGTDIFATADGIVTTAERQSGYGQIVIIQHAFGIETRYAHMSRILVSDGQRVSRGEHIGDMGSTGRSTGTHVHYEVRQNGTAINPMNFITAGRDVF